MHELDADTHTHAHTKGTNKRARQHKWTKAHTRAHIHTAACGYLAAAGGFKTLTGIAVTKAAQLVSLMFIKGDHNRTGLTVQI